METRAQLGAATLSGRVDGENAPAQADYAITAGRKELGDGIGDTLV